MNKEDEFQSSKQRKRSLPKYNKLSKEQKLLIIKEWDRTRLSYASIAEKYSALWGLKLSKRGVGDLVKYWRESGKIRGFPDDEGSSAMFSSNFRILCSICQKNCYPITESELKQIYTWNLWTSGRVADADRSYVYSPAIKSLTEQVANNLELCDPTNELESLYGICSNYASSSIFCVDFFFLLPKLLPSTEQPFIPSQCTSFIVWNAIPLEGNLPFHYTSEISLLSVLESLDNAVTSPSLVLLHCIEPLFSSLSNEKISQTITFDQTVCGFSKTVTFRYLTIVPVSRESAFAVLPTYRGLSQLFRLLVKTQLMQMQSVESALTNTWDTLQSVEISGFWGLLSQKEPLHFSLDLEEISPSLRPFLLQYQELAGKEAKQYFCLEEDLSIAGMDGLFQRMHQIPPPTPSVPDASTNDAFRKFIELYENILSGLPDTTLEDYYQLDRVCKLFS